MITFLNYNERCEYSQDTGRIIHKFDIYSCELGWDDDPKGTIGKCRPCVIISDDRCNTHQSNRYAIIPIRSEHYMKVSRDTLYDVVEYRRKCGKIYVPIEMEYGVFKFMDVTEFRSIPSNKVHKYLRSVTNPNKMKEIEDAIKFYLFGKQYDWKKKNNTNEKGEESVKENLVEQNEISQSIVEPIEYNNEEEVEEPKKELETLFSSDKIKWPFMKVKLESFEEVYQLYKENSDINFALEMLDVSKPTFDKMVKKYQDCILDNNFINIYLNVKKNNITDEDAMSILGIDKDTYETSVKNYKQYVLDRRKNSNIPNGFSSLYAQYKSNRMTVKQIAKYLKKSEQTVRNYIDEYESLNLLKC